jgi:hypothetical protein
MDIPYDGRDAASINSHRQYLLAEFGLALQGTLITPEQALELLHDCNVLRLVGPPHEAEQ